MKINSLPPVLYLKQVLRLSSTNSGLSWRKRPVSHFSAPKHAATWNAKNAGRAAGCHKGRGYYVVRVDGTTYHAHRIVFALHSGRDPGDLLVDHKNGNPSDNTPSNLQLATNTENLRKRVRPPKNNTSGVLGVSFHKAAGKWSASISHGGVKHHLGLFTQKRDAVKTRRAAEAQMFGHYRPGNKIG